MTHQNSRSQMQTLDISHSFVIIRIKLLNHEKFACEYTNYLNIYPNKNTISQFLILY